MANRSHAMRPCTRRRIDSLVVSAALSFVPAAAWCHITWALLAHRCVFAKLSRHTPSSHTCTTHSRLHKSENRFTCHLVFSILYIVKYFYIQNVVVYHFFLMSIISSLFYSMLLLKAQSTVAFATRLYPLPKKTSARRLSASRSSRYVCVRDLCLYSCMRAYACVLVCMRACVCLFAFA